MKDQEIKILIPKPLSAEQEKLLEDFKYEIEIGECVHNLNGLKMLSKKVKK